MTNRIPLFLIVVNLSCAAVPTTAPATAPDSRPTTMPADPMRKVELDLSRLDKNGLRGPADGKVAVAYEFKIPNTPECKRQVRAIDRTVQFMPGSRGRIDTGRGECLCIGSTHQKNFRHVLRRLAALPYVERIIECHFE